MKVTKTTQAIDTLIRAAGSYQSALEIVQAEATAGRLLRADARPLFTLALTHHFPARYAGQTREDGSAERNTALAKQVSVLLSDVFSAEKTSAERADIKVPKAIAEAAAVLWALCNEYEGATRLAAVAISHARHAGK